MDQTAHQRSDDELWPIFDQGGLWLVYGGGVVAEEDTLRKALHRAHDLAARGSSISEIVRTPGDGVVIIAEQITRLWNRLGLKVTKASAFPPATKRPAGTKKAGKTESGSVSRTKGKPTR